MMLEKRKHVSHKFSNISYNINFPAVNNETMFHKLTLKVSQSSEYMTRKQLVKCPDIFKCFKKHSLVF